MGRFFDLENPFWNFVAKLVDAIWLNLIFIIFSLPVITIGASATAMYTVTLKMVRDREGYMFKGFYKAFKENFKQATNIWIIVAILATVLWIDLRVLINGTDVFSRFALPVMIYSSVPSSKVISSSDSSPEYSSSAGCVGSGENVIVGVGSGGSDMLSVGATVAEGCCPPLPPNAHPITAKARKAAKSKPIHFLFINTSLPKCIYSYIQQHIHIVKLQLCINIVAHTKSIVNAALIFQPLFALAKNSALVYPYIIVYSLGRSQ